MANYTSEARASFQTSISGRGCPLAVLPETLQSYIFTLAGLATGKWIDLAGNSPQQDFPRHEHWVNEDELKTTSSLLSIRNRVLQAQISRSVYSGNHFFIDYHSQQGLDALLRLRPCTLKSLRSLVCYLNVSKGYSLNSFCWHRWKVEYQKRKAEFPSVLSDGAAAKGLISCWEQVCDLLGQYIPSGMLDLSVICDVDGPGLAQAIADPIVKRLPQLKNLRISFSPKRREDLAHLAHVTWLQATRTPVPSDPPPFRFFELPREIRTEILKYTELVLPLKEVHWSPQTKYDFLLGPHVGVGMSGNPGSVPYWKPCFIGENPRRICQLLYSAYDNDCDCLNRCWRSPRNLFLVSKAFYAEAMALFLQKNRFIVTPEKQWLIEADSATPELTDACLFLRHTLTRTALTSLRFLEIVFPPFEGYDYMQFEEPGYQEWLKTISLMSTNLNLPNLTLRVYMHEFSDDTVSSAYSRRSRIDGEGCDRILNAYRRIMHSLQRLVGLKQFFCHITWPTTAVVRLTYEDGDEMEKEMERLKEKEKRFEDSVERLVMGDAYDSMKEGKMSLKESQWLQMTYRNDW